MEFIPPHSPFGQIKQIMEAGFTYHGIMYEIPWCVILNMISDTGETRKKQENSDLEEGEPISSEQEELEFLGLA